MSYTKVGGAVAATVTALALSAGAYGDQGKSPNGAPGPAGNPNHAAAAPQANGPQGPVGNEQSAAKSHGKSQAQSHGKSQSSHGNSGAAHGNSQAVSHGKSQSSHGNSGAAHGNSQAQSHANPNIGTPRTGGREDRPAGKITFCHATRSASHPYVKITTSMNGLHGHGPIEDSRHHAGSWKDIFDQAIVANGCPTTVPEQQPGKKTEEQPSKIEASKFVAAIPEVATTAAPQQAVLGVQAQGGTAPAGAATQAPASEVLGTQASGNTTPKAALAARSANERGGTLPFTGLQLVVVLLAAAAALLGGFALRRATTQGR